LVSAAFGAIQAVNAQDIPILGYPYDTNQAGGGETEGGYRLSGTLFTLNGDATIMSMSCEMSINNDNNNPAPAHYRFAIYQDNAGTVGALIAQTEVGIKNPPAGGSWFSDQWRTVNFASPVSLQAGSYWLVVISEDKYVMIHDSYSINQSRSVHALVNSLNPPTSVNSSAYIDVPLVIVIYASGYGASSVLPPPPPTNDPVVSRAFLSAKSSDSSNGKIEIFGNLTANNTGVPLANMTFSYRSISESESMLHQFAKTSTDSNGYFAVDWLPPSAGSYIINATYGGDSMYGPVFDGINVFITDKTQVFTVESNSTVTSLAFNPENSELNLSVTGESGTTGFVDVYVSKSLVGNISAIVAYIDGNPITYTVTSTDDSWILHFNYHHSLHNIMFDLSGAEISSVPEMPNAALSLIIVALVTIAAVLIIVQKRRRQLTA
jgi:hypothetical protein